MSLLIGNISISQHCSQAIPSVRTALAQGMRCVYINLIDLADHQSRHYVCG